MFLNKLNSEEKVAFLKLAHHIARSDGDFDEEEKLTISTYSMEMGIDDTGYNQDTFNLKDTLSIISNMQSRKIVLMEIMALVYADDIVSESERKILSSITTSFELEYSEAVICKEWAKATLALVAQGQAIIEL